MKNIINALAALHLLEMKYLQKITEVTQEFDDPDVYSEIFKLENWKFERAELDIGIKAMFSDN